MSLERPQPMNDIDLIVNANPKNRREVADIVLDAEADDLVDHYRVLRESYKKSPTPALQKEMDEIRQEIAINTGIADLSFLDLPEDGEEVMDEMMIRNNEKND